jgi:hypothetical protein
MTGSLKLAICLIATLCTEAAFSQVAPTEAEGSVSAAAGSSPIAYASLQFYPKLPRSIPSRSAAFLQIIGRPLLLASCER